MSTRHRTDAAMTWDRQDTGSPKDLEAEVKVSGGTRNKIKQSLRTVDITSLWAK